MATKMYKDEKFKMVRGMDAKAHLDDGWTFEPSKTKSTIKPARLSRNRVRVKNVDIIKKPDLTKGIDQHIEETNNGD